MSKETTPNIATLASKLLKLIPKLHEIVDDIEKVAASALTQAKKKTKASK